MAKKPNESDNTSERDIADTMRKAVENANAEDESQDASKSDDQANEDDTDEEDADDDDAEDESDAEDDDESEDEESEDEDESEEDDKSKSRETKSNFKYKHLDKDGKPETYITNLEQAYATSSAHGIELNKQLEQKNRQLDGLMTALSADPDLAAKVGALLEGTATSRGAAGQVKPPSPTDNPFLVSAETEWKRKSEREAQEFVEANPEVVSDPKINADVQHWMEVFSAEIYKNEKRIPTSGEVMRQAYRHLGLEDKSKKRDAAAGLKRVVSPAPPRGKHKKVSTGEEFSDLTLTYASKMGISKERLEKHGKK